MKKPFLLILLILPAYLAVTIPWIDNNSFVSPVENNNYIIIRSDSWGNGEFAARRSGGRTHNGIDLTAPMGSNVYAVRSGRVVAASSNKGMGSYVIIRHSAELVTIYGHLQEIVVRQNQRLRQGWVIGSVGKTGNANSPSILAHLHFEVRKNGVPQDPLEYLE